MNGVKKGIPREYLILFGLLAAISAALFGVSMMMMADGHFVSPLDDSYIHYQYARRIAEGHFFEYTDGAGFSSGSTSVLYPILLAPFELIGFRYVKIIPVAFALGLLLFFLSACLIYHIGRNIAHERVGFLAAFLFLLNGHLAWNHFSGMETGLFTALILAGIYFLSRWWAERQGRLLAWGFVFLSLASVTRPEGFILLAASTIFVMTRARRIHGSRALFLLFSLAPFAAYMILVRVETGAFATAGVEAKSVVAGPYYTFWEKIARLTDNFAYIFGGYYHNLSQNYFPDGGIFPGTPMSALYPFLIFPPGAFLLALAGVVIGGARERGNGNFGPIALMSILLFLGLAAITNSEVAPVQYFRYLAPFQPIFLILAALGLYELSKFFEANAARVFAFAGTAMALLVFPSLFYFAYVYGENCNDIFEQHRRTSWWIRDNTRPDDVIGVTDTGAIGYFSDRRIYDFVGLTTPNEARHWRAGLGSAWERLEHLPPARLPRYIVSFPFVWGEVNFLGKPVHNAPLRKNLTTMGNDFMVYEQDWLYLKSGELPQSPPQGFALSDNLDVADLKSEEAHRYIWRERAERPAGWQFPNTRNFFYKAKAGARWIADGGRDLNESESFESRLVPGRPARMIARMESPHAAAAEVFLNGAKIGLLKTSGAKDSWHEQEIEISADNIRAEKNEFRIVFDPAESNGSSLHTYHYWFYQ